MPNPLLTVDWCLLRAQRNHLLCLPSHKHVDGLVNFLDDLIDHAVDTNQLIELLSPDTLEAGNIYKYVIVANEIRFFSHDHIHDQAVGDEERGSLQSAGTIAVHDDLIKIVGRGSISLKIPGHPADKRLIADLLGKPVGEVI